MKLSPKDLLPKLPGPASPKWPEGEWFVRAFAHGSMSAELFAPKLADKQQPHEQDELYVVVSGTATLDLDGTPCGCAPGDLVFVPAGVAHRFTTFSSDFVTWAIFWGPAGGER